MLLYSIDIQEIIAEADRNQIDFIATQTRFNDSDQISENITADSGTAELDLVSLKVLFDDDIKYIYIK